jgi:hypothetical protein
VAGRLGPTLASTAAAAIAASATTAAAVASTAARESATREAAARLRPKEGRKRVGWRPCDGARRHDTRDQFGAGLQVSIEQLGRLAVADSEAKSNRLELFVNVQPHTSHAFDWW